MNFKQRAQVIADEVVELLAKKQMDYGQRNILDFGEFGVLVRANDKVARLKTLLAKDSDGQFESITDTWTDLAGYAIIALMLRRDIFEEAQPPEVSGAQAERALGDTKSP